MPLGGVSASSGVPPDIETIGCDPTAAGEGGSTASVATGKPSPVISDVED
jgi:hypothetical protein